MTQDYGGEKFTNSQFLVFVNRVLALVVAGLYVMLKKQPRHAAPFYEYSYASISNTLSSWCQYEALKFVSFPTQVLAKASKVIPVRSTSLPPCCLWAWLSFCLLLIRPLQNMHQQRPHLLALSFFWATWHLIALLPTGNLICLQHTRYQQSSVCLVSTYFLASSPLGPCFLEEPSSLPCGSFFNMWISHLMRQFFPSVLQSVNSLYFTPSMSLDRWSSHSS